ncbi:hypothetical protein [Streptomyces sp. WM6386]|nr:hypothetical protein [Streptomyces sp. WM6386]
MTELVLGEAPPVGVAACGGLLEQDHACFLGLFEAAKGGKNVVSAEFC